MIDLQTLKTLPAHPETALWAAVYEEVEAMVKKNNGALTGSGEAVIRHIDDGFVTLAWDIGYGQSVAMRLSANVVEVLINNEWRNVAALIREETQS